MKFLGQKQRISLAIAQQIATASFSFMSNVFDYPPQFPQVDAEGAKWKL
jgi:hypothetical protein